MYVQWCAKGIAGRAAGFADGIDDAEARAIIDARLGILCNWWRHQHTIALPEVFEKLTPHNLDRHVHDYPNYGHETPFISLAAGAVERGRFERTNFLYPAEQTAIAFATGNGVRPGYVFYLWVIVGIKPAVEVQEVAEEIRNLNIYRRWSPFQLEGEITAKISIPSVQIHSVDKWEPAGGGGIHLASRANWPHENLDFQNPAIITNIRDFF